MGATSSSTWKRAEATAAAIFGAKRKILSGAVRRPEEDDGSDAVHPRLWIESKLRQKSAVWSLWRETRDKAKKCPHPSGIGHKAPVLVLREKYREGMLIVAHSNDLREVVLEFLAARSREELLEIEAGVRVRRENLFHARAEAKTGPEDHD